MKTLILAITFLFTANASATSEIKRKFLDETQITMGDYRLAKAPQSESCHPGDLRLNELKDEATLMLDQEPLVFGIGKTVVEIADGVCKSIITPYQSLGRTGYEEVSTCLRSNIDTIYEVKVKYSEGALSYQRIVKKKGPISTKTIVDETCHLELVK